MIPKRHVTDRLVGQPSSGQDRAYGSEKSDPAFLTEGGGKRVPEVWRGEKEKFRRKHHLVGIREPPEPGSCFFATFLNYSFKHQAN